MDVIFYISLFLYGSLFWSFASVIIYRLKFEEKWIFTGRSKCPICGHTLWIWDLFPIFSYICSGWKCRYCGNKISIIYPILEFITAILFVMVWVFLIDTSLIFHFDVFEIAKLIFWLSIIFITVLYIFYDILFLEIHEWIMFVWIILSALGSVVNAIYGQSFVYTLWSVQSNELIGFLVFILVFSLLIFYIIMLKWLHEIFDIILLVCLSLVVYFTYSLVTSDIINNSIFSSVIWALWIFIFFYLQIFLSRWRALGGGDLRIGIMIWMLLWASYSIVWIVCGYLIGSIIWIYFIIKNWKQKWPTQIPFWPFLWAWCLCVVFFSQYINTFIERYIYLM